MCQDVDMPDYDPAREAAAYAEMDALTADFRRAEQQIEAAREALREAIVRRLGAGDAPPGRLADHTPYDRNHVGRIAREGGVPPQRAATVRSIKPKRRTTA
jgi:hypothetical protein